VAIGALEATKRRLANGGRGSLGLGPELSRFVD
jgi:hypothetical protein